MLDDEIGFRKALAEDFQERSYSVTEAGTIGEIQGQTFDLAVIDLRLLGENGLHAITEIKKANPNCRIVVLTGYGSVATAVEAMKLGATNYLQKPVSTDVIEVAFHPEFKPVDKTEGLKTLNEHEHEYIEFVLTKNQGNITQAAKQLGLHRQSLQRKLKKYP
ncbi:Photosynthetic apparatus regulatory protein RegA [compost metagenome]